MKVLHSLEDPIRTNRGEAVRVLAQALAESLFLGGRSRTEEYAALALDLADALVTRCQPAGQRQDSLTDQLKDLIPLATLEGSYDAADWIKRFLEQSSLTWSAGTRVQHLFASPDLFGLVIGFDGDGAEHRYLVRWDTGSTGSVPPFRLRNTGHEHDFGPWSYETDQAGARRCQTCPWEEHG